MRYLAVELAPRGIRVNAVSGGVVETAALEHFPNREEMLAAGAANPVGRLVEPDDIAGAVAFLCSPDADDGPRPDAGRRRRLLAARLGIGGSPSAATSSFVIFSIAAITRCAFSGSGSPRSLRSASGTICHETPKRSFSHPHGPSSPPSLSAFQ